MSEERKGIVRGWRLACECQFRIAPRRYTRRFPSAQLPLQIHRHRRTRVEGFPVRPRIREAVLSMRSRAYWPNAPIVSTLNADG